jgi:hypothetical protein
MATLTDMSKRTHSTYDNDATFYLVLWMSADRHMVAHMQEIKDSLITLDEQAVQREVTFILECHIKDTFSGYRSFSEHVLEAWFSTAVTGWMNWPGIVGMYQNPAVIATIEDVHEDDKMVARILVSSSYAHIILKGRTVNDTYQVLSTIVQHFLGYYATTPHLWVDSPDLQETKLAHHIFQEFLKVVNWTQVLGEIVTE